MLEVYFTMPSGAQASGGVTNGYLESATRKGSVSQSGPLTVRVGSNVQAARLIHRVEPAYPPQALAAGIEGSVTVQVTINEEGIVEKVEPMEGHPLLLAAAADAVKQWRYSPTTVTQFASGQQSEAVTRQSKVITAVTLTFDPGK
jgi:TonB family protein